MIQLTTSHVDTQVIDSEHGLDLDKEYAAHALKIEEIVKDLYASKDKPGHWTKWLNLGYDEPLAHSINHYAQSVKGNFDDLVILGIGGSSLGGYALLKALRHPQWNQLSSPEKRGGYPRYHFLENVDSDQIAGLLDHLDFNRTLVIIISKSGSTAEPMSAFMLFKQRMDEALGKENTPNHVVAITDKEKGILRPLAEREGYQTFEVPDDVGGRFSIFSAVGLVPAALCGVDILALQRGVRELDAILKNPDIQQNPAAQLALIQYLLYQKGKPISVFMPYSNALSSVSDWYVQLWAESLGKRHDLQGNEVCVGPTAVRAVGATDQHSQIQLFNHGPNDKVITFVVVEKPERSLVIPNAFPELESLSYLSDKPFHQLLNAEFEGTRASLTHNQRPTTTLTLPQVDAYHFAQLLYLLEVQTAIAGGLFNIDPFNQPGVEDGKKYAKALMGDPKLAHLLDEIKTPSKVRPVKA